MHQHKWKIERGRSITINTTVLISHTILRKCDCGVVHKSTTCKHSPNFRKWS